MTTSVPARKNPDEDKSQGRTSIDNVPSNLNKNSVHIKGWF